MGIFIGMLLVVMMAHVFGENCKRWVVLASIILRICFNFASNSSIVNTWYYNFGSGFGGRELMVIIFKSLWDFGIRTLC